MSPDRTEAMLLDEIARVNSFVASTYRRGLLSGLRARLAFVRGGHHDGMRTGPPAHYTDRAAKTWADGEVDGWNCAHLKAASQPGMEPGTGGMHPNPGDGCEAS